MNRAPHTGRGRDGERVERGNSPVISKESLPLEIILGYLSASRFSIYGFLNPPVTCGVLSGPPAFHGTVEPVVDRFIGVR